MNSIRRGRLGEQRAIPFGIAPPPADFPQREAREQVLAVPIFPEITKERQRVAVEAIADFCKE